jgi:hypothetical protein
MAITEHLKTIRSNFSLAIFCHCLIRRMKPEDVATANRVVIGEDGLYCIPRGKEVPVEAGSSYDVGFAGSPDFNLDRAAMEFAKMALRNFTLDSYEALFDYCKQTGQLSRMQSQPWYEFARMVRNSLTHTQHWRFRRRDLTRLPVKWIDKVIEADMDGQELTADFYDWWDGCELWGEMYAFAETLD